jgi:hypothetical protein
MESSQNFCDCGIPLGLDSSMTCRRCNLAVGTSRYAGQAKATETPKSRNPALRTIGWIFLIYLVSALLGGLLSLDSTESNPPGLGEESYYEQNGVDDSFVGTP